MQEYPNNSYPSEEDLTTITNWDFKDPMGLINFIEPLFEEYGKIKVSSINNYPDKEDILEIYMATGGWSGNEEIIGAMQMNVMFWSLYWQRSERGGAFTFKIYPIKGAKNE